MADATRSGAVPHALHIKHDRGKTAFEGDGVLFCQEATFGDKLSLRVGDEVTLDKENGYVYSLRIDEERRQYHALVHVHSPDCNPKSRKILISHASRTGKRADASVMKHLRELADEEMKHRR